MKTSKNTSRIQKLFQRNFFAGLLICLVVGASSVFAENYHFDSWDTDDGLPQNSVKAVLQTRDGYLWFTTLDGAVRYDGANFTVFNTRNSPGIRSNRFSNMYESADGALWLGTDDGGLTRYKNGEFQTFTFAEGLTGNLIKTVSEDENGELLVATFYAVGHLKNDRFETLFKQPDANRTYFGKSSRKSSGGLWFWDEDSFYRFKNGTLDAYPSRGALNGKNVGLLFEDRAGDLWIGMRKGGLYRLRGGDFHSPLQDFPLSEPVKAVFQDRQNRIWFGTVTGGLHILENERLVELIKPTEDSGSPANGENAVTAIYQDREGTIWCGTNARGLKRLNQEIIRVLSKRDGLADSNISAILESSAGEIWIAAGNLSRYKDGKFTNYLEMRNALSLAEDRDGALWIGAIDGLFRFKDKKITDFTESVAKILGAKFIVYAVHRDKAGNLWLATDKGLIRFDGAGAARLFTTADGLAGNSVKTIYENAGGALWIGTYGGLSHFDGKAFVSYTEQNGLSSNRVRSIYEDASGTLWIGTYDGGLNRFREGKFTRYTTAEGLFNDGVFQILEGNRGNLWMSSNRGIYRVAKQQLEDYAAGKIRVVTSVAYGKQDGLLNTECNGGRQPAGIKSRDGRLWFPTQDGVAIIDTEKVLLNGQPPPVVIESVKIDRENVAFKDEIEIAPGKSDLEISYAGLSFIKPEQVRFRYKLEGLDSDWVEAGNRRAAYYAYIPPGEYNFRVIAANSDGVWNNEGATITFVILPPFYRTWWFSILSLVIIVGAAYLFYRRRINQLKRHRQTQEKFSHELLASHERERQRIAAELHDGLGQSLLVIKNRALLGTMSPDDKSEAQEQFEEISRASSRALEEVREIAYNLRPYHLDRLGLTQSIKAMLETINSSTAIDFAYDIMPLENVFPKNEEVIVYRIIQECVNNIVKHSAATEASVLIHRSPNGLTITIEDNGRGFTPHQPHRTKGGFGLIGLEERVRILGGTLQIRSEPDNGTTIIIKELGKNGKWKMENGK